MRTFILFLLSFLFVPVLFSQENPDYFQTNENEVTKSNSWAFSIKLNTFGPGVEFAGTLGKSFAIRLGGNYMSTNFNTDLKDVYINADADLSVGAITLLGDWYFAKRLHLTAGVVYNLSKESITGTPTEEYTVGILHVKPEDIGHLTLDVEPNKIGPYFGIGFGRSVPFKKIVSFNFEIGAVYHGKPKVSLAADGMISPTANEDNERILEDNLSSFALYPVISFQLAFKIF